MSLNLDALLDEDDLAFRQEVRSFLEQELDSSLVTAWETCTTVFCDKEVALAWQRKLLQKQWIGPLWPKEYGGPGFTPIQRFLFESECALAGAPGLIPLGMRMVAPVIMRYGTQEQKAFYLPRILSGEDYWCQGYSEPGAGSDLASLQCRAEDVGDNYRVTGTKIWTTHAHFANRIFCLVRTAKTKKPQAGISFLLIDLATPGITISPIKTLAGDHELNQVFFDDVIVPKSNRLGGENKGWECAKYLLEFERGGDVVAARLQKELNDFKGYVSAKLQHHHMLRDIQKQIVLLDVEISALQCTELRAISESQGELIEGLGSMASVLKVIATETEQKISALIVDTLGDLVLESHLQTATATAMLDEEGDSANRWAVFERTAMARYLNKRAASIYGGSNEIQRNIIAKAKLAL